MPRFSTITLVIPQLQTQPSVDNFGRVSDDSVLGLIAGRGQLQQKWCAASADEARLESWQRGLIGSLGLNEADYPSAPVSVLGADGQPFSDWLHAEPVHLSAGMNEVSLVPLQSSFQLTEQERDELTPLLRAHLAEEGLELQTSAHAWLIGSQQALKVSTVNVDYAKRNEWADVLPKGEDAGRLRRLMTELQMLLHEHPVNDARAARGVPVVNSLWLWGNGRIGNGPRSSAAPACLGGDEYLRGICKVNEWPSPSGDSSVEALIHHARSSEATVSVLNASSADELETRWLKPIVAALRQGQFARLEIVLDEWQLTIDRWQLRKFWRRSAPFGSWAPT